MSDSELIAVYQQDVVNAFVIYALAALVTYEYIITVREEVTMVWRRKSSLAKWMFIANRYLMVAVTVIATVPATAQVNIICPGLNTLDSIVNITQDLTYAGFSTSRMFAISKLNVYIALVVLGLNMVPVVTDVYILIHQTSVFNEDPVVGTYCGAVVNTSASVQFNCNYLGAQCLVLKLNEPGTVVLVTCTALSVADMLVLVWTWRKTYKTWIEARKFGIRSLSGVLLRDGTVYFIVLLLLNIAQVLVNTPSLQIGSPVINIAGTLQPILTSRFLLNLRQAGEPKNETNETFNSRFTVPGFRVPTLASIIDNIGEDLDHGLTEEVDEMMESNNNISAASQASVEHANTVEEIQEIPREVIF